MAERIRPSTIYPGSTREDLQAFKANYKGLEFKFEGPRIPQSGEEWLEWNTYSGKGYFHASNTNRPLKPRLIYTYTNKTL